jgi:YbbR domain-containing protein
MMERLLKNNTIVKVVAFFLASILWIYVTSEALRANTPEVSRQFRNVPLAWHNLDEGLAMLSIPGEIDVMLYGRADLINELTPANIRVYVDLQGIGEGQHRITPNVEVPRNIRVVSLNPQQVVIELEQVESPQLSVTLEVVGTPAEGFVVGEPRLLPATVFVTGPRSALALVDKVRVLISVDGANEDRIQMIPAVALNANGIEVSNVEVHPAMVEVTIPVSEPQLLVPVRVPLDGQPAAGYQVRQINIDPATVMLTGPGDILREITEIVTAAVDITDAAENVRVIVSLVSPHAQVRVGYTGEITVEIIIEPE